MHRSTAAGQRLANERDRRLKPTGRGGQFPGLFRMPRRKFVRTIRLAPDPELRSADPASASGQHVLEGRDSSSLGSCWKAIDQPMNCGSPIGRSSSRLTLR